MNLLLLLVLCQTDPLIEKVERLSGDVRRPLLWTALKVTVSSAAGFDGRVEAWSSFNFRTAVALKLMPGGRQTLLLPALDPEAVTAGKSRQELPRAGGRAERIVLVDESLPFAAELSSTERVFVKALDLKAFVPGGHAVLEAADLILVGAWMEPVELPFRKVGSLAEAQRCIDESGTEGFRIEAVEARLWTRSPEAGWIESKRTGLVYLAVLYAALGLGLFASWRRLPKKLRLPAAVALPALLLGLSFAFVPAGMVTVTGQSVTAQSGAETWDARIWFVGAGLEGDYAPVFPRLVKPVFPTAAGAELPFVLLFEDGRARIEGLKLGPRRQACFAGVERGRRVSSANFGVVRISEGVASPADLAQEPDVQVWSRWLGREGSFSFLGARDLPGTDVSAPGLAEGRERRGILLQRGKP